MTILAHKIRLTPTLEQEVYFKKACGTARFVYNWALQEWQTQYRAGGKPSALGLKTRLNAMKRTAIMIRQMTALAAGASAVEPEPAGGMESATLLTGLAI